MIDTFIFDFDGVFADSKKVIWEGYNHMLKKHNQNTFKTFKEFNEFYTVDFLKNYERLGFSHHEAERASKMVDSYVTRKKKKVKLFDDMVDFVFGLPHYNCEGLAYKLGIASSGTRKYLRSMLKPTGLLEKISVIVGGDSVKCIKPHPACILKCMGELGAYPRKTAFVGDTLVDFEAGKEAGVAKVILVSWGFDDVKFLENANPGNVIYKPEELLQHV
ncbi:MAG: HAD-IA family hydrolase [Candidatus Woesearchaeota archaeon]